ncbi:PA14 domain-containing protein [Bacillus halotolerans]|uniref:PA14 domain-containing protein n=1 Tax=Bacillus halotolerans TaxID=260554 RepID=A0A9Q4EMP5_9BACI|nr:PA14 domain-containing protein [Bacillus halotolerans]MCY9186612.1 PA14 domain-containing protein [Bacillus halotolerans]
MRLSKRKRNAIHSGIGDNDDLFVKRPKEENAEEQFQYAARLRGKKRHDTQIYPELPFEYGISYTGQTLEVDNQKDYKFDINAHPERTIGYRIEQTKELPVERLWEAKACFEAEVRRFNMKYALQWSGKKAIQVQNTLEYAVNWKASVTSKYISDARDFFTSKNGKFIGYGDSRTWKKHSSGYVYDYSNVSRFSGIIAKGYYGIKNYEAEFDFKTVLATNDQFVGGDDDDVVGLIFKAKDNKNFYMMLWERDGRVQGSWRAPDHLDGFNMLTSGSSAWEKRVSSDGCKSSRFMSSTQWNNYKKNKGWRLKHRRIYKVTNGVMKRVDTTPNSGKLGYSSKVKDLGNGKGWELNQMHSLKVNSIGKRVKIYVKNNDSWSKVFEFDTDWEAGSFGLVNVSQAVQFHRIEVREKSIIKGRIPEKGWSKTKESEKNLGTAGNYCKNQANQKASELKVSIPSVDTSSIEFLSFGTSLRDRSKGSITSSPSENTNIIAKAGSHTEYEAISGRIPKSTKSWFSFDGIGDKVHASNALEYVKSKDSKAAKSNVTVQKIRGIVKDNKTGRVVISSMNGQIIAHNNNPKDAGQIYKKCYVRCGIVEVTPDHRDFKTGLVVFSNIANVFKEDYKEFFNREDYINKKAKYELLKPVKKDPPKPPVKEESEAGCVVEEPIPHEEIPIIECLNDFDFDGKRLVMWSCEFPVEVKTKLFEDKVFAYRGWTTFNPLIQFEANKWTLYKLMPIEETIKDEYDEIKWAGRNDYDKAPPGTKVIIKTTEWYKAIFPADIVNSGLVTNELDIKSEIPPAPEHYYHPSRIEERMPDSYEVIHYLLDGFDNHSDVVMWFESNPLLTTENADKKSSSLAQEGRSGMPIVLTSSDNDKVVIHCKEDPRYIPWASGKYIGYGKLNGKRPFSGHGSGKADMVNVPTDVVYFPDNLVAETLEGPFIDIHDEEFPSNPRIKYRLHSSNKLIDFSSDYQDSYIWYTDWYSKWVNNDNVYTANMKNILEIENPVSLDPTDTRVSEDYNPDDTIIERIEVISNNPFVKVWTEEEKGDHEGLLGSYYRYPLTSEMYEESWQVTGDYKEWDQTYEIKSYMDKIEIPIEHNDFTILEVKVGDVVIQENIQNGWTSDGRTVFLHGNSIKAGLLHIKYSTGNIINTFELSKGLGKYIEVYVGEVLLDPGKYKFDNWIMTIDKDVLYLNEWVKIQSYELNDLHDPTKRQYLGELQYTQLDFQEDIPTKESNPNFGDEYYEGSFCFNWGYKSPKNLHAEKVAAESLDFKPMSMFLSDSINFKFNVDMELVYPVGKAVDISNFTGDWVNWNQSFGEDDYGDWHGPPEKGYDKVINLKNQNRYSAWYNPKHLSLSDYAFSFKVESRTLWDNDIYGCYFRFDNKTHNYYSFEWDAGGMGINGMAVYKNTCQNPEVYGKEELKYTRKQLGHDPEWWDPDAPQDSKSDPNRKFLTHTVKISVVGNRIQVFVDDRLAMDVTDSSDSPFSKGAWGPMTKSTPDTYFWDFWMQTYKRVTYRDDPTFRKEHQYNVNRLVIEGEDPLYEIELDKQEMTTKFQAVIDNYCRKNKISKSSIVSTEYFITEDQSDYEVYFKEFQKIRVLELSPSILEKNPEGITSIQQAVKKFGGFDNSKTIEITQDTYENWSKYKIENFDVITFTPADCNAKSDIVSDEMENFIRQFKLSPDKVIIFTHDTGANSNAVRFKKLLTEFGFSLSKGVAYTRGNIITRTDNTFNYPYDLSGDIEIATTHWNQVNGGTPIYKFAHEPERSYLSYIDNVYYSEAGDSLYTCSGVFNQQLSENEMKIWINLICRIAQWVSKDKPKMTRFGQSKLYATVKGQYPKVGRPDPIEVPNPEEPHVPELNPPTEANPNDGFTISWNGYIYAPVSGVYRFQATVNDGFRLWVNGKSVINEWHVTNESNLFPVYESTIYLEGNKWHSISANYFDNIGQALIRLLWAPPNQKFQRINPDWLTPYLGYRLFAKVKDTRPLPWSPMIHNGYYYHEDREHYLYAQKIVHKKTPNEFHEISIEPRPQQGSAIIVRDNEGNNLRKVTFYDDAWNLTLENKELFSGNGYAKYYLNYRGIDQETLKIKVNGKSLLNYDFIFNEEESSIEFMEQLSQSDEIEVKYKLLYSYYIDMNSDLEKNGFVKSDKALIQLHSNYDPDKMKDLEIIYESALDTPFYRANEVTFNPLLNHNHSGFLYITEEEHQEVKEMKVTLSEDTLSNTGKEKVLLTVRVTDIYNNPCPNKDVKILRDNVLIEGHHKTNEAGEVYLYDQPTPTDELITTYKVEAENIIKEVLLNYYIDDEPERFYLDIDAQKLSVISNSNDTAIIHVYLRDKDWSPVGKGEIIKVEYRNSYNETKTETKETDDYGHIQINVSGLNESNGNIMVKVSYDMGFEEAANFVHLRVIGG